MPWLTSQEELAVARVIASGRLVLGPQVRAFEQAVAAFVGKPFAISTTSGTTALQLALQALGVDADTSVIVPAYTWVATYNVAHWLGAQVVLADVDPHTFCISEQGLLRALSHCSRPKRAILPVHMFGYRVEPSWLDPLIATHQLITVGDGCCAFGGMHQNKRCGSWTAVECLSFHPRKVITTGEGGMILVEDEALAHRLERLRDHGAVRSPEQRRQTGAGGTLTPQFPEPGHNLRMTELQGALGHVQMQRLDELLKGSRRVAAHYDARLAALPWLKLPPGTHDPGRLLTCYVPQLWGSPDAPPLPDTPAYTALSAWRSRIMSALAAQGIAARPPMVDLVDLPFTQQSRHGMPLHGARTLRDLCIGLPFFAQMTPEQVDRSADALIQVARQTRPPQGVPL